ncbi:MAG: 50S ribosomal protein L4 [Nanoarchaeota archaeon]|nr:50S ribosomal protein L4 [Nanoarchaeota archaeon]
MKSKILTIDGKEKGTVELPKCFSQPVREDLIMKVLEAKKRKQPYAPSLVGGKQSSASGKLVHRRHVWKSQYGRGMSRVPRKSLSRRGTQFNWVGAEVPNTRGGRRAHPPKIIGMINTNKINKKEEKIALMSAISATANEKMINKKYEKIDHAKNLPLIVESGITKLKTKELLSSLKKILGELFEVALQKKKVRSGKGKLRGRKYKKNAGLLLVVGKDEKIKTSAFDISDVKSLGINDVAKGGAGRLTIYTENAIKNLGERFKEK